MAQYSNNFKGLVARVNHKIRDFSLENQSVALGVSGGADSIGLFWVFCELFKQKKISGLVIFHVNFGFRGEESDGDERFVAELCHQNEVPFEVRRAHHLSTLETGRQEAARTFRRQVEEEFFGKKYIVALAHTATDVAENVLFRIARGVSPENAAGMSFFNGFVFRPFLEVTREGLRDILSFEQKCWREDSSNSTEDYSRNLIRHRVLPVLESLHSEASLRISKSFLNTAKDTSSPHEVRPETFVMPLNSVEQCILKATELQIHEILTSFYGGNCPVPRRAIEDISKRVAPLALGVQGEAKIFHLPEKVTLEVTKTKIRLFREEKYS